jgi:riboflavin kinase/FMN adenylyltransferase
VRSYLSEGEVGSAREILGAPYFISGKVESGNRVGKTLGFPTINVPFGEGQINLRRGVYLTGVKIGEKIYRGLTNVGTCPTFKEREMHTETYILDYNSEIYGEEVKIFFLEFIREEKKFESPKALKDEVDKNIKWAMERDIKWQEIGLK